MPTFKEIARRMLVLDPTLGREVNVTTVTGNTVAANQLRGTAAEDEFEDNWLVRRDVSNSDVADRVRMVTAFDPFTGAFAHETTAYADTTGSGEVLEILAVQPHRFDAAVQFALRTTRFLDQSELPTRPGEEYSLADLSWITSPTHIQRVGRRPHPVLTRNRRMGKWNGYSSSGALVPDDWGLAGSGASFARSSVSRGGGRSLSATRSGANVLITQRIRLMESGVSVSSLRGEVVTGVVVARSANASSVTVKVDSENATEVSLSSNESSTHSGGGAWEELSQEHTIHASAESLLLTATVKVNEAALIEELYAMHGVLTDSQRFPNKGATYWRDFDSNSGLAGLQSIVTANAGLGGQLIIETLRPYAEFDATRVAAGTHDADVTDCPLEIVAHGGLWRLHEGLVNTTKKGQMHAAKAERYRQSYRQLAAGHIPNTHNGVGLQILPNLGRSVSARVR